MSLDLLYRIEWVDGLFLGGGGGAVEVHGPRGTAVLLQKQKVNTVASLCGRWTVEHSSC